VAHHIFRLEKVTGGKGKCVHNWPI